LIPFPEKPQAAASTSISSVSRFAFRGLTTDDRAPKASRAAADSTEAGGDDEDPLQIVPSNVIADALDSDDLFTLYKPDGKLVASSHVRGTFRLQIPPVMDDPPPSYFPFKVSGRYISSILQQLASQPWV
jgi:hypothetical protein